jgi:hypothetical protein
LCENDREASERLPEQLTNILKTADDMESSRLRVDYVRRDESVQSMSSLSHFQTEGQAPAPPESIYATCSRISATTLP